MSDDSNDYVGNREAIETGPVRIVGSGDPNVVQTHILEGRKMLAKMKNSYGVNDRVAAGEPGGFYRAQRIMPDGCRVECFTNDGQDTLRITVPQYHTGRTTSSSGEGESTSSTAPHTEYTYLPDWPLKPKPEEEPPIGSYKPFLWIGIRILKAHPFIETTIARPRRKWEQRLHACLWEPRRKDQPPSILSNRNQFEALKSRPLKNRMPPEVYPLGYCDQYLPSDYRHPDTDWLNPPDYNEPWPTEIAYTDDKLCLILPLNVYNIPMRQPDYDPKIDEDIEWDIMFLLDPDNDLNLYDTAEPLNRDKYMFGSTAGGEYQLKIMAVGHQCLYLEPCEIEIKIMNGKDQYRFTETRRITIEQYTNYRMGMMPLGWFQQVNEYGTHSCQECNFQASDFGANPHGPHWWQGMATVFLPPLQYEVPLEQLPEPTIYFSKPDKVEMPDKGFEPGKWFDRFDMCSACYHYHNEWRPDGEPGDTTHDYTFYKYTEIYDGGHGVTVLYTVEEISEAEYLAAPDPDPRISDVSYIKAFDECTRVERFAYGPDFNPDQPPDNDAFVHYDPNLPS